VNDHTDVWFIGYTPRYATGVWMGNPERKESLGSGMTGGGGALPFFNGFMNAFLKDKPVEKFPEPPPIPSEIKTLMERNKREELEKLAKAEKESIRSGAVLTKSPSTSDTVTTETTTSPTEEGVKTVTPGDDPPPLRPPVQQPPPRRDPDPPPAEKPEGSKPKGKKGDN
jgi:penicillin-binding protein 1A